MRHRLLLAFGFVLLLAAPLRAQDVLDGRFTPSNEAVGSGDYKGVFGVEGHPDLVMALAKYDDASSTFMKEKFAREKADLERLEKAGVYVAKIEAIGTYQGRAALVMKRYETGSKATDWADKRWSLLNETSILELKKIERALTRSGLEVQDLQFLVDKDGHVVVADPEEVGTNVHSPSDVKKTIDAMIHQAEDAIAWRQLEPRLRAMPGADDEKLRDVFATRDLATHWSPEAEPSLAAKLVAYLEHGDTTDAAKAVAAAIQNETVKLAFAARWEGFAANEILVPLAGMFPTVAAGLLQRVHDALFGSGGAEKAKEFLDAKRAPSEVRAPFDRGFERGPSATEGTTGVLERLVEDRTAGAKDGER